MNPYSILGLDRKTATPAAIKQAYRKKAAAAHPDNTEPVGDFHEIQRANRILADPTSKQIYDETGIVQGEDKLAEAAIWLIIQTTVEIMARNPECELMAMLRATIDQLTKQCQNTVAIIEKCIAQVEKRWHGADMVKNSILLNMHNQAAVISAKINIHERAKQLLAEAKYDAAEMDADKLVSLFFARRGM